MNIKILLIGLLIVMAMVVQSCSSTKPQSAVHKNVSAHEQVAEKIHEIVSDPKRADEAISISEKMIEETEGFLESVIESRNKAIELSENYDTTREALDAHYEVFFKQRKAHSERYITFTLRLRDGLTEQEWDKLNKILAEGMLKLSTDSGKEG